MKSAHVAFCLDQAYGNIIPTLGIALRLIERGHRISYTVPNAFASLIRKIGATPVLIEPLNIRQKVLDALTIKDNCFDYRLENIDVCYEWMARRTVNLIGQMERQFHQDRPDLFIHDDSLDTAGRDLAKKWGIPRVRHLSQFIDKLFDANFREHFMEDSLVLMTVPEFFQRDRSSLDRRFKFVGFIPEGRSMGFERWKSECPGRKFILVSATTGLLPQREFHELMTNAIGGQPWQAVLSMSGKCDSISAIEPQQILLPFNNIRINDRVSNFELVEHACLYIGQGGQGGSLEALYWGIPQIVIPAGPYHYSVGRRIEQLKLGHCLPPTASTPDKLRIAITQLLNNEEVLANVKQARDNMHRHNGAQMAVDVIESFLQGLPV